MHDAADVQRLASLEQKSQNVTGKLLELQQKHKEISDRVQNVLLETVDIALGGAPELKEYMRKNSSTSTAGLRLNESEDPRQRKQHY